MTIPELPGEETAPEPTLLDVIVDLRRDVEALQLPLEVPGAQEARESRVRLLVQLDNHLIPRLRELSTPAVVVVAGSTGAGKSTLVNSMLGSEISRASVIRPTTREPVLAFHPADGDLMTQSNLLGTTHAIEHEAVPRGIAIVDAPDLDSLLISNRESAVRMLDSSDLWLFVTTAARYGDALPWQALEMAQERGASVAVVLNRVSAETLGQVRADLLSRLRDNGMANTPLFVIPDAGPHEGLLEPDLVAPVKRWLTTLAGADHARTVILRTLRGSIAALRPWVAGLVEAVEEQTDAARELLRAIRDVPTGLGDLTAALQTDAFVAGALDARWGQMINADPGIAKLSGARWLRPTKRTLARRNEALGALREDVREVVVEQLGEAVRRTSDEVRQALTGPDAPSGGPGLVAAVEEVQEARRRDVVVSAADEWFEYVADAITELGAGSDRVAAAVRGLGPEGFNSAVLMATLGGTGAQRLLDGLLGSEAAGMTDTLRGRFIDVAEAAILADAQPYAEHLRTESLSDDAPTAVRLRLAELKRVG